MTTRRLSARVLAVSTLGLALGACSLAPTYHRPDAPVPDRFPVTAADAGQAAALPAWRDFFQDPRLQALIELALKNNRDLRIAVDRVEEARAQFGIAQSDRLPTIGAQGTGQVTRTPPDMRNGGADAQSVNRSYIAGVGMTAFELDFFGRVRNLSEAAYQSYLSTDQARRTVQLGLIAQTAEAYFRLRSAQVLHELMDKTLEARKGTLDLVQSRFDVGVASDLDLAQAQSQYDTVRADRIAAEWGEPVPLTAISPMMLVTLRMDHFLDAVVLGTGRPLSKISWGTRGLPSSSTEAGEPERMIPLGCIRAKASAAVVKGAISL